MYQAKRSRDQQLNITRKEVEKRKETVDRTEKRVNTYSSQVPSNFHICYDYNALKILTPLSLQAPNSFEILLSTF